LATNDSLSGLTPFTKVIGFDLGSAPAPSMGGRYMWGLPVPVSAIRPGTNFDPLVDFDALVTIYSSIIVGPFAIKI
jgi:hypothetical protein